MFRCTAVPQDNFLRERFSQHHNMDSILSLFSVQMHNKSLNYNIFSLRNLVSNEATWLTCNYEYVAINLFID